MNTLNSKFGFYSALVSFVAAAGYCVVQILQVLKVLAFPWDDILIFGFSLFIAMPFMLAILALHYSVPAAKKIWSNAALALAIMYAAYASFVYIIQLAVVIPGKLQGKTDSINILNMSVQHSFFWTLDALTYITMGLSTLFGAFAFARTGFENKIRWFFLANAFMTPVIGFVYFYPHFSTGLLMMGSLWIITAPGSILLLAIYFKRQMKNKTIPSLEVQLSLGGKKVAEAAIL